ncbi:amidohydrolase family protein [Paenirhodobacter populi]|uniref:Amidohydrolase n=1 Tax=Paenirhodobacter populi TaxID=2306993 RepID=A0A443JC39_9RHOB|nr:amidohydrolase family protein [Sinirhodobacter populi]RWR18116.1 amidohydrolase [Sinirhodobacter populi]
MTSSHRILVTAGQVIAYRDGAHRLLRNGSVIIEGDIIVAVTGAAVTGTFDERIDLPDALLTPGLIDMHAHITSAPYDRSYVEDVGRPGFYFSGLPELLPAMGAAMDHAAQEAAVDFSLAELTRSGTTTVFEIGWLGDYTAEAVDRAGLRAYVGEGYGSARWRTRDGRRMSYDWKSDDGQEGFEAALAFVDRLEARGCSRVRGLLTPMQVAMVTPGLLARTRAAAAERNLPVTLHAAEAVFEFQEMLQREGMSPVEWLETQDFLWPGMILGHGIFTSGNSWIDYPGRGDIDILARTGASVAHCAWVFARRGIIMESFARYRDAGVNMCIGTDTAPQSMLKSMRAAAILSKVADRDARVASAREVFDAATLAPARVLGREDLGRISPGARADLLLWDTTGFSLAPMRDPLRNLVYYAESEDLHHVMVDGNWLMRDGALLRVDEKTARTGLQAAARRVWDGIGPGDWAGRRIDQISPCELEEY